MLSWVLDFDESVDTSSVMRLDVSIRRGACALRASATEVHQSSVVSGAGGVSSPLLPPGEYSFSVQASDNECLVLAEGCTALQLPLADGDEVRVALDPVTPAPCANCVAGVCLGPDAGVPDSGGTDSGGTDSGGTDAGVDSGPPPTYSWSTGEFGECSVACGAGEETRTVTCTDSGGAAVADALCTGARPGATQPCDVGSSTCGLGMWSPFSACDGTCTQTQTRPCTAPGHCLGELEQQRSCSGGGCCPTVGASCGPTTFRRSGSWICRDEPTVYNSLFYGPYIFTFRECNASNACVTRDQSLNVECICAESAGGCTSSTSGCGTVERARCRNVAAGTRDPCPAPAAHAECF